MVEDKDDTHWNCSDEPCPKCATPMTGDGAVVREWTLTDGPIVVQGPDHYYKRLAREEHNALVAHALAQAAEIERLTQRAITSLRRADAHRARTADLLKALERYGQHELGCRGVVGPAFSAIPYPCTCGLAAAKGETV